MRPASTRRNARLVLHVATAFAICVTALTVERSQAATTAVTCNRWASFNTGSDSNNGTAGAPVRSILRLIQILSGPTAAGARNGCLVAGEGFVEPIGSAVVGAYGGTPGDPVVIQSSGAPRASVQIYAEFQEASHDITFTDIDFVGTPNNIPQSMLIIDGDRITFRNNDITHGNGICIDVGRMENQDGLVGDPAEDLLLDRNRIHDCGTTRPVNDLGSSGLHGIYIQNTTDAVVTNNFIFDNMNRGVQLFPLAQHTLVEFNVIDGNSSNVNIGRFEDRLSESNLVRNNIITNARLMEIVDPVGWPVDGDQWSVYGNFPVGHQPIANIVAGNCVWFENPSFRHPNYYFGGNGVDYSANVEGDPLYVNRAAKVFTLQAGSPCAGKGPQPEVTTCNGSAPTIIGTEGPDTLTGTGSADVIMGLGGNDVISGLAGDDKICAGGGHDLVGPGTGNETNADGGTGRDTISYADATSISTINLTNGEMFQPPGGDYDTFLNFENAIGGTFAETLIGSPLANQLDGGGGNDIIHGYAGNDVLIGGIGADEFHGWEGRDMHRARDGVGAEQLDCGADIDYAIKDALDVGTDCENTFGSASDFDGDGNGDAAVYRPIEHRWYPGDGVSAFTTWGADSDILVPGDYNGDGDDDYAAYRPTSGRWYVNDDGVTTETPWGGVASDLPVPGDYNGDGDDDVAIYRPSNGRWYVNDDGVTTETPWGGVASDLPVPGDYNGDGDDDVAIFRPSSGRWYVNDDGTIKETRWGVSTDIPVVGDYNGDGDDDFAVYRPSTGRWYVNDDGMASETSWGISGALTTTSDRPQPGDYNGDGDDDLAIFRPSSGRWYVNDDGTFTETSWGTSCDIQLALPYPVRSLIPRDAGCPGTNG